jgi:hypothetical protein
MVSKMNSWAWQNDGEIGKKERDIKKNEILYKIGLRIIIGIRQRPEV